MAQSFRFTDQRSVRQIRQQMRYSDKVLLSRLVTLVSISALSIVFVSGAIVNLAV